MHDDGLPWVIQLILGGLLVFAVLSAAIRSGDSPCGTESQV